MLQNNFHPLISFTDGELFIRLNQASDQLEELLAQSHDCYDVDQAKTLYGKIVEKRDEVRVYVDALEEFGYDCSGKCYLN
ncbi:hypothetical protein ACEWBT_23605 [Vibrio parahaemolyticus]|uniref:hypothetical protein n=1 Tax=Vibrio parahaemolyticus TaxID=670 RepID=UPI001122BDE6|nr:hypothetical protein [Vibrio parahaemolyticus]EGQ8517852.1 hypothetical protein [Vibrio parahaemolyticus]EGR0292746.1 hypothetical protein [Vibrio parahaemolyticus]EJG1535476.1 hypothetical protein [Vibrio parahaemolyticus]EJO2026794.1 hypothetical protein [Vibrio parahaemolyticus]EKQ5902572.1 hypothetical protein [Vibrio parahaemolyticus]